MYLTELQIKIYNNLSNRIYLGKDFKIVTKESIMNFTYSKYDLEWHAFIYDNTATWKESIKNGWVDLNIFATDRELKTFLKKLIQENY